MKVTARNFEEAMKGQMVAKNKPYTREEINLIMETNSRGELLDLAIALGRPYKAVAQAKVRERKKMFGGAI